jgi:MinD superfamily P-loop ATPase
METLRDLPEAPYTVLDAEPGVTGRVVTTVKASDVCVLVTEPTPFGLHDLELAVTMTRHIGIPVAVIINRSSIGNRAVSDYCRSQNIPVLLEIPFDRRVAAGYAVGKTLVEILPDMKTRFAEVLVHIERIAKERGRS